MRGGSAGRLHKQGSVSVEVPVPLTVRDALTPQVTLPVSTPLYQALLKLGYAPYGVAVDGGRVVGTVVRAELEQAEAAYRRESKGNPFRSEPKVLSVMRTSVVLLGPDMSLCHAAGILQRNQIVALPVVDDKRILGVITLRAARDRLGELWKWAPVAA